MVITLKLPRSHSRDELYGALDRYLAAMLARDPSRVRWASSIRNTENNVALEVGDGLWNTITGRGGYDLRFADTRTGQVGLFTTVDETSDESACTIRLGIVDGAVAEVGSSRVDLQACKLEYSIVSPK